MHCSLQVVGPVLGSPVERSTNVVGVFTGVVTLTDVSLLLWSFESGDLPGAP